MHIDVYDDVVCPWCFIGNRRLDRAIESLGLAKSVTVRHHAFMLDPNTPDAGRNLHEELRRKYGQDPQTLFARVEAEARQAGIPLELGNHPFTYPTARAHTLVRHAEAKGTQHALIEAFFEAYFLGGKNIADPGVLVPIATSHGFTADEASSLLQDPGELELSRRDSDEAHQRGIRGVPFFVFDNGVTISGGQAESLFRDALQRSTLTTPPL